MGKKRYVGNLTYNVSESDLEALFSQFGTVQRAPGRQTGPGRQPQREMPPTGMADPDDVREVERVRPGDRAQVIGGAGNSEERPGIASAGVADPAELDVPGGEPGRGQRLDERCGVVLRPVRQPGTAVHEQDDRETRSRRRSIGQAQVGELDRTVIAITDARAW